MIPIHNDKKGFSDEKDKKILSAQWTVTHPTKAEDAITKQS
jgi:hypothetical protein